jgi:hypothetical protein
MRDTKTLDCPGVDARIARPMPSQRTRDVDLSLGCCSLIMLHETPSTSSDWTVRQPHARGWLDDEAADANRRRQERPPMWRLSIECCRPDFDQQPALHRSCGQAGAVLSAMSRRAGRMNLIRLTRPGLRRAWYRRRRCTACRLQVGQPLRPVTGRNDRRRTGSVQTASGPTTRRWLSRSRRSPQRADLRAMGR